MKSRLRPVVMSTASALLVVTVSLVPGGQGAAKASSRAVKTGITTDALLQSSASWVSKYASIYDPANCLAQHQVPLCYSPQDLRAAYGIDPLLERGVDGKGVTVLLPEIIASPSSPNTTDIEQDLAAYDGLFGLPPANVDVVSSFVNTVSPNAAGIEEVLDVEMVHAIAPGAAIRVLLVPSQITLQFVTELGFAVSHGLGNVISMSFGTGSSCLNSQELSVFHAVFQEAALDHVTALASTGDLGTVESPCSPTSSLHQGVNYPAADPLVTAVGGTRLLTTPMTHQYEYETAWNEPVAAGSPASNASSGGGFSQAFQRPFYQNGFTHTAERGIPDVSADADTSTGFALIGVVSGQVHVIPGGGTSAGAPLWAGITALADQYAGHSLGLLNPALYQIGHSPMYHVAFHDVTEGNNTETEGTKVLPGYQAGPGWDPVTGLGTPNAAVLVPMLVSETSPDDQRSNPILRLIWRFELGRLLNSGPE